MRLKDFVDIYRGYFNVRVENESKYLLVKVHNETYQADIFREFDKLEIKLINNCNNNVTIIV